MFCWFQSHKWLIYSWFQDFFPDIFKTSHVMPLLKEPSLSKNDITNYTPVSNLNFASKIIEKVMANQIRSHLERNELSNQYQSAYKKFHSTETALLKVKNDIILNMNEGRVTAFILLDLSAAFDTQQLVSPISCQLVMVSMGAPLTGLSLTCHIVSRRWNWWTVYNPVQLKSRVGFPKDPSSAHCYLLSTLPSLSYVIQRHKVKNHLYADDTQIYIYLFR